MGSGFYSGLGPGVFDFRCRVSSFEFRGFGDIGIWGFGFWVLGLWLCALGFEVLGFWVFGFWVTGYEFWVLRFVLRV